MFLKSADYAFMLKVLLKAIHWLFPDFAFMWLVEEAKKNMPLELDFLNEGHNAEKVASMLAHFPFLKVNTWKRAPPPLQEINYKAASHLQTAGLMVEQSVSKCKPVFRVFLLTVNRGQTLPRCVKSSFVCPTAPPHSNTAAAAQSHKSYFLNRTLFTSCLCVSFSFDTLIWELLLALVNVNYSSFCHRLFVLFLKRRAGMSFVFFYVVCCFVFCTFFYCMIEH